MEGLTGVCELVGQDEDSSIARERLAEEGKPRIDTQTKDKRGEREDGEL
jgi:hypothetical protein